jgi:hypothetical protein
MYSKILPNSPNKRLHVDAQTYALFVGFRCAKLYHKNLSGLGTGEQGVRKSMERISSRNIPLTIYHGVPNGWSRSEVVAIHKSLGGTFQIAATAATEPGAPAWMPDRYNWLQYRETLRGIAKGIKVGESACVELAIRYIELNYFGFLRARFARLLKSQNLSKTQISRLTKHFEFLIQNKQCFDEFKEYNKLRKKIAGL